jgi:phosphate:Na+ symporter
MADMVEAILRDSLCVLRLHDRARAEAITFHNRCVDQLGGAIRRYLADIGDEQPLDNHHEGARAQDILAAVINLEHVGDIVANSLVEFALRSQKLGSRTFSSEELEMVTAMHGELLESLRLALTVFLHAQLRDAKRLIARKTKFREFDAAATALSVRLLRSAAAAGRPADTDLTELDAENSDLFLRTVRDLRRIHSHVASFAYPILHRPRSRGRRATGGGAGEPPAASAAVTSVTAAAVLPAQVFHSGNSDEGGLE